MYNLIWHDCISYYNLLSNQVRLADGDVRTIDFAICVMAAGAQSGEVSKLTGVGMGTGLLRKALPVEPR